jgi:hypothetical protein
VLKRKTRMGCREWQGRLTCELHKVIREGISFKGTCEKRNKGICSISISKRKEQVQKCWARSLLGLLKKATKRLLGRKRVSFLSLTVHNFCHGYSSQDFNISFRFEQIQILLIFPKAEIVSSLVDKWECYLICCDKHFGWTQAWE